MEIYGGKIRKEFGGKRNNFDLIFEFGFGLFKIKHNIDGQSIKIKYSYFNYGFIQENKGSCMKNPIFKRKTRTFLKRKSKIDGYFCHF